jgi:hypothetical protein
MEKTPAPLHMQFVANTAEGGAAHIVLVVFPHFVFVFSLHDVITLNMIFHIQRYYVIPLSMIFFIFNVLSSFR